MRVSVLTISDSVAAGKAEDRSGPSLMARCGELGWEIASFAVCADDRPAIEAFLRGAADSNSADLILTTGGTGVGPRDVTPEATAAVCERLIPGFSEQMRNAGRKKRRGQFFRALPQAFAGRRSSSICRAARAAPWSLSIRLPTCCRTLWPCYTAHTTASSRDAPKASDAALLATCKLGFPALNSPRLGYRFRY